MVTAELTTATFTFTRNQCCKPSSRGLCSACLRDTLEKQGHGWDECCAAIARIRSADSYNKQRPYPQCHMRPIKKGGIACTSCLKKAVESWGYEWITWNEEAKTQYRENRPSQAVQAKEARQRLKTQPEKYLEQLEKGRIRHKQWRKKNPEKWRAGQKQVEEVRRAREHNAPINDFTADQWLEMQAAYGYRCVYCPPTCWRCRQKKHNLTKDHITPLSRGGSHTYTNIVPACQRCNSRKNAGTVLVPIQPLLLITKRRA